MRAGQGSPVVMRLRPIRTLHSRDSRPEKAPAQIPVTTQSTCALSRNFQGGGAIGRSNNIVNAEVLRVAADQSIA